MEHIGEHPEAFSDDSKGSLNMEKPKERRNGRPLREKKTLSRNRSGLMNVRKRTEEKGTGKSASHRCLFRQVIGTTGGGRKRERPEHSGEDLKLKRARRKTKGIIKEEG